MTGIRSPSARCQRANPRAVAGTLFDVAADNLTSSSTKDAGKVARPRSLARAGRRDPIAKDADTFELDFHDVPRLHRARRSRSAGENDVFT